jgi:hypothetical protein
MTAILITLNRMRLSTVKFVTDTQSNSKIIALYSKQMLCHLNIMLSVVIASSVMLSAIMESVLVLSVVAPSESNEDLSDTWTDLIRLHIRCRTFIVKLPFER